jgi:hypothetical protein
VPASRLVLEHPLASPFRLRRNAEIDIYNRFPRMPSMSQIGSLATEPIAASQDQCPLCPQSRPNFAGQRNDAKCQKRTSCQNGFATQCITPSRQFRARKADMH